MRISGIIALADNQIDQRIQLFFGIIMDHQGPAFAPMVQTDPSAQVLA
jgi:hypothetical protein